MTTVVFRDGVMSSDSRISASDVIVYECSKLARLNDGSICGYAGSPHEFAGILKWLNGKDVDEPKFEHTTVLVYTKKKELLLYDSVHPVQVQGPYIVLGTGTAAALGALYMGATAIEAVEAAISIDTKSGGKVHFMTL